VTDYLTANSLLTHVQTIAVEIGPRPAGHRAEQAAHAYVRDILAGLGYESPETLPFPTPDTWGYAMGVPLALSLAGHLLKSRLLGSIISLGSAYAFWEATRVNRQPLLALAPRYSSRTLLLRVPPTGEPKRRVVLLGHVDTNKARATFHPRIKKMLLALTTAGLGAMALDGLIQLGEALWPPLRRRRPHRITAVALLAALGLTLYDERGGYIPGAGDNGSAVAVLLGLAAHLRDHPLQHTEVWLAFTGAEEVGGLGTHVLLDVYGNSLRDAWFIDLEMVSTEEIVYVTRHSGFSYLSSYTPDGESLAWAEAAARRHPEYGVHGRPLVIGEEVGTLRARGYRGICLAGVGPDGWLAHWHRPEDDVAHLNPDGLEKAARFAWVMMQMLDEGKAG